MLADGTIGEIGGISFKIAAAQKQGATLFFAPQANIKEAQQTVKKLHATIQVVPVQRLEDAIQALTKMGD
jgi:PDZ domain-containing protein